MSDLGELDDLDLVDEQDAVDDADGEGEVGPELYYPHVEAFVTGWLAPVYRRHLAVSSALWCRQWWRHSEAIVRLEALWRSWEHLRCEPALGMSVWLRDHADPHMAVLMNPDGPFRGCRLDDGGHKDVLLPLPLEPAPEGLFDPPQP